jgi:hypothetical protein
MVISVFCSPNFHRSNPSSDSQAAASVPAVQQTTKPAQSRSFSLRLSLQREPGNGSLQSPRRGFSGIPQQTDCEHSATRLAETKLKEKATE